MTRIHVASSNDPLTELSDITAICTATVQVAQFVRHADSEVLPSLTEIKRVTNCRKCQKAAEPKGRYVYAIHTGDQEAGR